MRKLNKKDKETWQSRLAYETYDKSWRRLSNKQQEHIIETVLPQEIDREPYKT